MAVLLLCAGVMVGGVFYTSCMSSQRGGPTSEGTQKVALKVAGLPIYAEPLSRAIADARNQFGGATTPEFELMAATGVIKQAVDSAARAALIQQSGAPVDNEALVKAYSAGLEDQVEGARSGMIQQGLLKPTATQAEFEAAFKKQSGKTLDQAKADAIKTFRDTLADPDKRSGALMSVAPTILQDQAAAKLSISDADILKSFDRYEVKKIVIKDTVPAKGTVDERISKVQQALKSGTTFEQAIDRYSEQLPFGGKKLSETTTTLNGTTLLADPNLKPIAGLKAGQVSAPLKDAEGMAIYKIVSVKSDVPKDYQTRKESYKRQVISEMTRKDLEDQLAKFKSTPGAVKFESAGFKAAYDYQEAQSGAADPSAKDLNARYQAIYEEAKKASESGGFDERVATLARFGAINALWASPNTDKEKLRPEMVATLKAILDRSESFDLRMRLVDLHREAKQFPEAVEQLVAAAQNNKTDQTGRANNMRIGTVMADMLKAKQITPAQQKQIEDAQKEWMTQMVEAERQQAEVQKAQKEAEAEAAKEAAKQKANEKNAPKPGATTGTTASTGTTGATTGTSVMPPVSPVPPAPAPTTGGATKK